MERKWYYMRTPWNYSTRYCEIQAGDRTTISVPFVDLRKRISRATVVSQANSLTNVFNADCFLPIVASFNSSWIDFKRMMSGVGCTVSCGVFFPPGFRAMATKIKRKLKK